MSKALLIIDVQQGFLKSYKELPDRIAKVAQKFKDNNETVIAFQHLDDMKGSPSEFGTAGAEIPTILTDKADITIQKKYPISFKETNLQSYLDEQGIKELFITGFNMEFCILFTSIAAADRGYDVTVIEDLCGSENDGSTYEMNDLDITDFIGTVMDWSELVTNKYLEETEYDD